MIETLEIPTPVRHVVREGGKSHRRYALRTMSIRRVTVDEAPAVIAFRPNNHPGWPLDESVFRAFEGKLWHRLKDLHAHPVSETAVVPPMVQEHPTRAWTKASWTAVHDHPFLPERLARQGDGDRSSLSDLVIEDQSDSAHFARVADAMAARMADAILVDGWAWVQSTGPLLTATTTRDRSGDAVLRYRHPEQGDYRNQPEDRLRVASAFDVDQVVALHEREHAQVSIVGSAPRILSHDGWSRQAISDMILDDSVDSCAWSMIYETRSLSPSDLPPHVLRAAIDLRSALETAYGRPLDFGATMGYRAGMKEEGEAPPPADRLQDAVLRFLDTSAGIFDRHVELGWKVVGHALRERLLMDEAFSTIAPTT